MPITAGQEGGPDHRVEVEEPVGEARRDQQRQDQPEHPAHPVQGQQPTDRRAEGADPRFQLTSRHRDLPARTRRTLHQGSAQIRLLARGPGRLVAPAD